MAYTFQLQKVKVIQLTIISGSNLLMYCEKPTLLRTPLYQKESHVP